MCAFEFNSKSIESFFGDEDKNILTAFHYTSTSAFHSIIDKGFARFSDIRFMNDRSEMVYTVKVILDYLDSHPNEHQFTRKALNLIIDENFQRLILKIFPK